MMSLFEIDEELDNCLNEETGEFDEDKFNMLTFERERKIEYLAKKVKNHAAMAEAIKTQKKILEERQKREERNAESLKQFLIHALNGEKFKTAEIQIGFRRSKSVDLDDESFVEWCQSNERDDLLRYSKPEISKAAVKEAIEAGETIPARIIEKISVTVR